MDSSAIIKAYVTEIGSTWVNSLVDPMARNKIYLAHITAVEVISAISRGMRGHGITASDAALAIARFRHDFSSQYRVISIESIIINSAINLAQSHYLRGYDAVQLAVACELHRKRTRIKALPLTFVSADIALNSAATKEGMIVDDPNAYP